MKILVTGSHGLIGSALVSSLSGDGNEVVRLARGRASGNEISWNPDASEIDKSELEGFDAVIHLAGESIADRWTEEKKKRIRKSRVEGTQLLANALASLAKPPAVLISSSAIGFYGDRGSELLTEESAAGNGFLAEVCRDWEAATEPAGKKNIRVAILRTGVVLSTKGGALKKMLPPFQMGAGGIIGSGKQFMSWVALTEMVSIVKFLLSNNVSGPVNAVAPNPVTNEEFTATLGACIKRPTILPLPAFAAHMILGEMADELLLASARVKPTKLLDSGYSFIHTDLAPALKDVFDKHR